MQKIRCAPSERPATYFPLNNGRYEVKTGLNVFGTDFGNGIADRKIFQIDCEFGRYREAKLLGRQEQLSKYHCTHRYSDALARMTASFIAQRLPQEHPAYFRLERSSEGASVHCHLTGEQLVFDADMQLVTTKPENQPVSPAYASSLDALASQIQEDVAVVTLSKHNWISALHICFPNHWAVETKIGKDFAAVHAPVPHITKINSRAPELVHAMVHKGPYVRFVWGLSTDQRLNHHPDPPAGMSAQDWPGRFFDIAQPRLYLRVERQTIWGLPEAHSALFTIRTYHMDCKNLIQDTERRQKLESAIESMSLESLAYKGLAESKENILAWLRADIQAN
ncbi:MAG: DUF3445 domain-containing protein [Acidiferrobacterales bacterium]